MAEQLSAAGVSVFMPDMKGDIQLHEEVGDQAVMSPFMSGMNTETPAAESCSAIN